MKGTQVVPFVFYMKTLYVIGGGAAGFFCAVNAARMNPSLKVLILESSSKLLSKVKVSGGGRCNVTHACFEIAEMIKRYPRGDKFLRKAFHQFFTTDTIQWFQERGVQLKTESDGRMFPITDSSQTIINCLLREADRYGVEILLNTEVKALAYTNNHWLINTANKKQLTANYVCIACGGFAKASKFDWIKATGHSIEEPVPSLFTFNIPDDKITEMPGVSVPEAEIKITGTKFRERGPLLITHWGLSGPAVLRLSAWAARQLSIFDYEFSIIINWLPQYNEQSLRERLQQIRFEIASQKMNSKNPFQLPQRLWNYHLNQSGVKEETRWADLPSSEQNKLMKQLCAQELKVKGKTTFKEEFVTAGGIKLTEVNADTMQSKIQPGLFFAGEILDVDGITGGFNFQNAWTTGFIAAKTIAGL